MATEDLKEVSDNHLINISDIHAEIYDAIEADILAMTSPDTAVFQERPDLVESAVEMIKNAKKSLESLQKEAERPMAWWVLLGYDGQA